MTKRLSVVQIDVFSAKPLEGNALAVVLDGNGLTEEQMQLPFAGHPTLGTAFVLRARTRSAEIRLDLNAGLVSVSFEDTAGQPSFGEMTQVEPKFGAQHDPVAVARVLGLAADELDRALPVETVSTGLPFTVVPIRTLATMRKLYVDHARAAEYLAPTGSKFFYFVSRSFRRSALRRSAGCAAAWMVAHGIARPEERVLIEQGVEMQRPSRIFVRASMTDNRVVNVRVGGNAVEVMRGEISL